MEEIIDNTDIFTTYDTDSQYKIVKILIDINTSPQSLIDSINTTEIQPNIIQCNKTKHIYSITISENEKIKQYNILQTLQEYRWKATSKIEFERVIKKYSKMLYESSDTESETSSQQEEEYEDIEESNDKNCMCM